MPSAIAPIAGAVVGGLMGGGESGGQQVSKDPWGPAQEPLRNTLTGAQQLQTYLQQNPWNPLQQTAYQNTFTDLDAFRGQNNGLMQFANQLMSGPGYQRGGSVQRQPMGLLAQPTTQGQGQGLLSQGIFSIPAGQQYGQLNWKELNPYTATNGIKAPEKPVETDAEKERKRREEEDRLRRQQGEYYRGEGA